MAPKDGVVARFLGGKLPRFAGPAVLAGLMLAVGCESAGDNPPGDASATGQTTPTAEASATGIPGADASPTVTGAGPTETAPSAEPSQSPVPTGTGTVQPSPTVVSPADASFSVERAFQWLELDSPTFLAEIPDDSGRIVVLEQAGRARVFTNEPGATSGEAGVYVDLKDRVNMGGNEEGLLGLAFHPSFEQNGRLFLYYSAANPRRSVVSEFNADNGGNAYPGSERVILEVGQRYSNHNGGMLAFGPDGYLYIGLGDGGSSGDPHGNGQNPHSLLGSILRIDVDSGTLPYAVPADNPFASGSGGAPEVWAYGLRNPWRFAFDPATGELWVADVGQNQYEEVSLVERGGNYGWNVTEGPVCYQAPSCDQSGLEMPVAWYDHDSGCSITGGYMNRDPATPSLNDYYIFADYCSGIVWLVDRDSQDGLFQILDTSLRVTSFGETLDGSMYLVAAGSQAGIYRLVQE